MTRHIEALGKTDGMSAVVYDRLNREISGRGLRESKNPQAGFFEGAGYSPNASKLVREALSDKKRARLEDQLACMCPISPSYRARKPDGCQL